MILFQSELDPQTLAKALVEIVFDPKKAVEEGVPFEDGDGNWELSRSRDTILDVHQNKTFAFRDRHFVKSRLDRARECLKTLGVKFI